MTKKESAIISAFTGILCGPFSAMQEYADEKFGRPTYTHEFGSEDFANELKERTRPDFVALCEGIES